MTNYDAIVIGGGPGGSTVSILLAQAGHRILLLEKSRFPRHKLCGEFITPECSEILERLGVGERMFQAGAQRIHQWTIFAPDGRAIRIPIAWIADGAQTGMGLTRARMDAILLDRAREMGVEIRENFLVAPRFENRDGLGTVEGKADGVTIERFSGRLVIDASGRHSVFSEEIPAASAPAPRLFGCKVYLRGISGLSGTGELFFFRDGYGGVVEVEDERVNLCFCTTEATLRAAKGDREKLLDLTLRSNPAARHRLRGATIDGEWLGTGPIRYGWKRPRAGMLAVGDAGAFIDPFTGSGLWMALSSGELAAQVINRSWAEGLHNADRIANRYRQRHHASLGLRFMACGLLRGLTSRPLTRNLLVSLLARYPSLLKLVALSTRRA